MILKPATHDTTYLNIIMRRLLVCKTYKPKFGQRSKAGLSLQEFRELYAADAFYSWFGLDDSTVYTAHRAAGGITSVYRQIGIGCEELFRQILIDHLGLNLNQVNWSYEISKRGGGARKLSLDARILLSDIPLPNKRDSISHWISQAARHLDIAPAIARAIQGTVFEVRQGYKSKDSKRQNADIANASMAYSQGYLPVVLLLSAQMDNDIIERYERERWLLLQGFTSGHSISSTYTFLSEVIGYDLAAFFQRNSDTLKATIGEVLETLLRSDD